MQEPNSIVLRFPRYSDRYDEIRIDNFEAMKTRLNSVEDKTVIKLINGCFEMGNSEIKDRRVSSKMALNTWHLVVTLCSEDSIRLFIDKGVDIQGQSKYKYNIIHSMILAAAFEPELEDALIEKYRFIVENISIGDTFKLLMSENDEGMRPLEFALHNSVTGLFQGNSDGFFLNCFFAAFQICANIAKVFVYSKYVQIYLH